MSRITKSDGSELTKSELVDTFTEVLEDFEVVSKSEVEAMIDSKLSKAEEGGVGSIEDVEETKAEANTYDPAELEQVLPPEVWEVVRTYLSHNGEPSEDMDVEPESDVEKAVNSAIGGSGETLRKVRGEAGAPFSKSDTDPSYESTEDGEGSETDMVLKHVNEALEQPTDSLNKSESKSGNVSTSRLVLDEIDRADL